MSARYVKSIENCASERGRRVRIHGVGNGLVGGDYRQPEPRFKQAQPDFLDGSTIFLLTLIAVASAYIYLKLSHEAGFRTDLYYDLKYIEVGIFAFMGVLTGVMALFHHWVVVKTFEGAFMRAVSATACAGVYFIAFHVLFLLSGGMAHLQVNAVAQHCGSATYKEKECLKARSRLNGLSHRHRRILTKTSSLYGKMRTKASPADMALFQLIVNRANAKLTAEPLDQKK